MVSVVRAVGRAHVERGWGHDDVPVFPSLNDAGPTPGHGICVSPVPGWQSRGLGGKRVPCISHHKPRPAAAGSQARILLHASQPAFFGKETLKKS